MRRELIEELLLATDLGGELLPKATIVVLFALWSQVDPSVVTGYTLRDRGEDRLRPPLLMIRRRRVASIIGADPDDLSTVDRHVGALRKARWIAKSDASGNGQLHLYLFDAHDRTRLIASSDRRIVVKIVTPQECESERRSPQNLKAISAKREDDLCRFSSPPLAPSSSVKLTVNHPPTPRGRGRGALDEYEATAIEIVHEAICPPGCTPIPATVHGARFLAAQLRGGWSVDEARAFVAAMPRIIARKLRERRWYGPAAFEGERFDRWLDAWAELRRLEAEGQATPPAPLTIPDEPPAPTSALDALAGQFDL